MYAIRSLVAQPSPDERSKDLVAFIIISLRAINASIEGSVEAWEKRGYWVKADRFRLQWEWTARFANNLFSALESFDWSRIVVLIIQLGQRFQNVRIPKNMREPADITHSYQRLFQSQTSSE